ncbi:MAG TPA: hypothetical protein VMU95_01550 [Trebonia sp.]|nr:hypothetical protein [Trebonia sp.]
MVEERLSAVQRIIAEKTVTILLVRGENPDGDPIYAYVAVRADKLKEFMAAQQGGTFYPEDYGEIIEAGEGEPSDEVRHHMEAEYGFNHEGTVDIPDTATAQNITANIRTFFPPADA